MSCGRNRTPRPGTGKPRILLGIDPGTRVAGWGVVEVHGSRLTLCDCGVLKAGAKGSMGARLAKLFDGYETLLRRFRPDAAAIEETFAGKNPKSAIAMGVGRGVALLALARAGMPILEIAPREIKKAVTGHGGATKDLVARMVCARLQLKEAPEYLDATDALATAIALAHRMPKYERI